MNTNEIYLRVDRQMNRDDRPWFPLILGNAETKTYVVDKVRPLSFEELKKVPSMLSINTPEAQRNMQGLLNRNRGIYNESTIIGVVLDARVGNKPEGWIGDMIEASRVIRNLRADGKKVAIINSHPDITTNFYDDGVETIAIPPEIQGKPLHPWNKELLQFVGNELGDTPILFPLNAHMPLLHRIDGEGNLIGKSTVDTLLKSLKSRSNAGIKVDAWASLGLHQLQALQTVMYMIGNKDVTDMRDFPPAYIYPAISARNDAMEIIEEYNCFPELSSQYRKGRPLFLHPGVATDMNKLEWKSYPEEKWRKVIEGIAKADVVSSITFLTPIDPEQAAMTARLAKQARTVGLPTSEASIRELQENYNWSLGTFAAFLQYLSLHDGIALGVDSMPVGHLAPAMGIRSVVLGNQEFNPSFFSPSQNARIVMPATGKNTSGVLPEHVVQAITDISKKP